MPTIYRMESLFKRSKFFDRNALISAQAQARAANGKMLIIPHLKSAESYSADESLERTDPNLFRQIMPKDYDSYINRLGKTIRNTPMLTLVLAEEGSYDKAAGWLNGMYLNKHIFMSSTIPKDPTPVFSFETIWSTWHLLAEKMKDLGISKVYLAGELAFYKNSGKTGCVYFALDYLKDYFPVKVLPRLTFPGIY